MTRTRTSETVYSLVNCSADKVNWNTEGVQTEQVPFVTQARTPYGNRSITDVVTDRYAERISKGEIINNPMNSKVFNYTESIGTIERLHLHTEYDGGTPTGHYSGTAISGPVAASTYLGHGDDAWPALYRKIADLPDGFVDTETVVGLAVNQAWANIDYSEASLLETMGELPSTTRFFISTFKRLIKIYKALKKLDLKALRGEISPKELRDRYLEARYAIRPLVYDTRNILKAIQTPAYKEVRKTFRGYAEDTHEGTIPSRCVYGSSQQDFEVWATSYSRQTVSVRAGVLTASELINAPYIWGLDKIPEVALELTSFSFIAGWFLNIADTLAAWTPNVGTRALTSWASITTSEMFSVEVDNVIAHDPLNWWDHENTVTLDNCNLVHTRTWKERRVEPKRAIIPSFNVRLDTLKLIDLAAILWSLKDGGKVAKVTRS